jgi:hypothetical protein
MLQQYFVKCFVDRSEKNHPSPALSALRQGERNGRYCFTETKSCAESYPIAAAEMFTPDRTPAPSHS